MSVVVPHPTRASRYTGGAIVLHWIMAIGILLLCAMGLTMVHRDLPPERLFRLYQLHKSIGITVLIAALLRLLWRVFNAPPPLPPEMKEFERQAARGMHVVLYVLLIGLPLVGWALVSASVLNIPTVLFSTVPWPDLPIFSTLTNKAPVEAFLKDLHAWGAWLLILLVGAHGVAALRHHFIKRDDVLRSMLPSIGRRKHS